jgi:pimeloyl-ACP methyl ester carboxylesterase
VATGSREPITTRVVCEIVAWALATDDPRLVRRLVAVLSAPPAHEPRLTPALPRAYARARETLTRYLAERDTIGLTRARSRRPCRARGPRTTQPSGQGA